MLLNQLLTLIFIKINFVLFPKLKVLIPFPSLTPSALASIMNTIPFHGKCLEKRWAHETPLSNAIVLVLLLHSHHLILLLCIPHLMPLKPFKPGHHPQHPPLLPCNLPLRLRRLPSGPPHRCQHR